MKFVDLVAERKYYQKEIDKRQKQISDNGIYLFGEQSNELINNMCEITNRKNCVLLGNATDALTLLYQELYKEDTVIILPNFSAIPTGTSARNVTDKLYYVDVDKSLTIDISKLPKNIKNGIMVSVNLFGNICNREKIEEYCKNNNHIWIEDNAQCVDEFSDSKADYLIYSFYMTKPVGSEMDGGCICSNNNLEGIRKKAFYGINGNNEDILGVNSRMSERSCAVVNSKIKLDKNPNFVELNDKRRKIAFRYLQIINGIEWNNISTCFHQFPVLWKKRKKIIKDLEKEEIPYMIHYPIHLTDSPVLQGIHNKVGYRVNNNILSLPIHPFLKEEEIQKVEEFLYKHKGEEL